MAIKYCTHRDLKDTYPNIDEFDTKVAVYGWVVVSGDKYASHNSGLVTQLFVDGESLGAAQGAHTDLNVEGEWFYNSTDDVLYYYTGSNPNDKLIEAGDDWPTLVTRYIENASRYVEARLDSNLPRKFFKDVDGNYDYVIVRAASSIAVAFLIRAQDPTSEVAGMFWEEGQNAIEMLNSGSTKLSNMVTADSSEGILTEIQFDDDSTIRPIDTRGQYNGIYDRIQIKVTKAGVIGVAEYGVWVSDSTALKTTQVVSDQIINGSYQSVSGGLQIRFSAPVVDGATDVATLDDEWELEAFGRYENIDSPAISYRIMTRL